MLCTLTTSDCLLPLRLLLPGLAVSTLLCLSTPSPGPASSSEPRFIDTSLEPGMDMLSIGFNVMGLYNGYFVMKGAISLSL